MTKVRDLLDLLFEGAHIRVATVEGVSWFVAKDVCAALGIVWSGASASLERIQKEWHLSLEIPDSGQRRKTICISEAGVFKLAFRSNKPVADRLCNWLAEEVLPCLLRYGCYPAPDSEAERFRVRFLRLRTDRGVAAAAAAEELERTGLLTIKAFRALHGIPVHDALSFAVEVQRQQRGTTEPKKKFYLDGGMRGAWSLVTLMRALVNFQPRLPLFLPQS